MAGLCIYTMTIITTRLPLADIGIAIAVAGVLLHAQSFRMPAPLWLFLAFVVWSFAGSFTSAYPEIVDDFVVTQVKLLCVMALIVNTLRTEGQIRFFLVFYLACFMAYPARVTLLNWMSGYTVAGRAIGSGLYYNSNELATQALFALGVALGLGLSASRHRIAGALALASALVLLVVILLTQSRGAVIGLVLTMVPTLLVIGWRRPVRLIAFAFVVAMVVGIIVPPKAWNRLSGIGKLTSTETIAEADPEGSAAERFKIFLVGVNIAKDNPVFGVGLGAYGLENARYAPDLGKKDTHNTYLNLAAEVGIPGLLLWVALVWNVLRGAYRMRQSRSVPMARLQFWLESALWAYLISALFGTYSRINILYVMLAVLWCSTEVLKSTRTPTVVPAVDSR